MVVIVSQISGNLVRLPARNRRATSSALLRLLKAEIREKTFTFGAKSAAGRDHDIQFPQHPVEGLPARFTGWRFHPNIRRICAAMYCQTRARALPRARSARCPCNARSTHAPARDLPRNKALPRHVAPDNSRRLISCSIACATVNEAAIFLPIQSVPANVFGKTVNPHRTPVKPPVLEKLRNSIAHSRAPSISKIECGIAESLM